MAAAAPIVSGRVTSATTGAPVADAVVSLANAQGSAQTSADGHYSIAVPDTVSKGHIATLVIRRLGFQPQRQDVAVAPGVTAHDVALVENRQTLMQMVVAGTASATPVGCYQTKSPFFPSRFTLDTAPGDTLPLRLSPPDARRFPIAYWLRGDSGRVVLVVSPDSTSEPIRIKAAVTADSLSGATIAPDDELTQPAPFTATRCKPAR